MVDCCFPSLVVSATVAVATSRYLTKHVLVLIIIITLPTISLLVLRTFCPLPDTRCEGAVPNRALVPPKVEDVVAKGCRA